jgi:hypothetical protein
MKFVAEDLKKFWLGHENNDITAQYAEQMFDMNEWRQTEAAKVGLVRSTLASHADGDSYGMT